MLQFSESFYLDRNTDVAAAVQAGAFSSALEHFNLFGWKEGRDPHDHFDVSFYLAQNEDVAAAGVNPFDHYSNFGETEGRSPNALFDPSYYASQYPDVVEAGIGLLEHFINHGASEGRFPSAAIATQFSSAGFDESAYLAANTDVGNAISAGAFSSGFEHWTLFGYKEGRSGAQNTDGAALSVPNSPSSGEISGSVTDGKVAGATVGIDLDGDGVIGPDEPTVTTDALGNFVFPSGTPSGPLIATGGTDTSTGLPFEGKMEAPAGSTVVNPLTTVIKKMADSNTDATKTDVQKAADAQAQLKTLLGLSDIEGDITQTDFVTETTEGDTDDSADGVSDKDAARLYAASVQLLNIVDQGKAAITGADGSVSDEDASAAVFASLAEKLASQAGPVDLTGTTGNDGDLLVETIKGAAYNTLSNENASKVAALADSAAKIAAAANKEIDDRIDGLNDGATGADVTNTLVEIVQTQKVVQSDAANQIKAAAGSNDPDAAGDTASNGFAAQDGSGFVSDDLINSQSVGDVNGDGNQDTPPIAPPEDDGTPPAPTNSPPIITGDLLTSLIANNNVLLEVGDLFFTDSDDGNLDVIFTTSNFQNGRILVEGVQKDTFSAQELLDKKVVFSHDGTDAPTGSFDVTVEDQNEDGSDPVPSTVTINIIPVDFNLDGNVSIDGLDAQGRAVESKELIANTDRVPDPSGTLNFTYQWLRGQTVLGTEGTYIPVQADVGFPIKLIVSVSDPIGRRDSTEVNTADVQDVDNPLQGTASISGLSENGEAAEGQELSANVTNLSDPDGKLNFTYQWLRGETVVGTGATYTPTQVDVGSAIRLVVTADDPQSGSGVAEATTGTTQNIDNPLQGAVAIVGLVEGNAIEGQELSADTGNLVDQDGELILTYQWLRGETVVGTEATYTPVQADVGFEITLAVSTTDPFGGTGRAEAVAGATQDIENPLQGSAVITGLSPDGNAVEGQVLSADTSGLSDPDGALSFTYQWLRGETVVGTEATYRPNQNDVGSAIKLIVSTTDPYGGAGISEVVTGATEDTDQPLQGTALIAGLNEDGNAVQGQELSAIPGGLADADGALTFTYQWLRGETVVGTEETYTPTQDDVGTAIKLIVSTTDPQGGVGSSEAISGATENVNDAPLITGDLVTTAIANNNVLLGITDLFYSDPDDSDADITFTASNFQNGRIWVDNVQRDTFTAQEIVDQKVVFRHDGTDASTASFSVTVEDQNEDSSDPEPSTVTINIVPVDFNLDGNVSIDGLDAQGRAVEDQQLSANIAGVPNDNGALVFTYQWLRGETVVGTDAAYTPGDADVGAPIKLVVSVSDPIGRTDSTDVNTGATQNVNDAPVITGDLTSATLENNNVLLEIGDLFFTDPDDDNTDVTFSASNYQNGRILVEGVQRDTFTGQELADQKVVFSHNGTDAPTGSFDVTVEDQNEDNSAPLASTVTINIIPVDLNLDGNVSINGLDDDGNAIEGQELSANIDSVPNPTGTLNFTYQWLRGETVVGTEATYMPEAADIGSPIKLVVSVTDPIGRRESTDVSSGITEAMNSPAEGSVTIDNTSPSQGDTLTASNTLTDADGLGDITYQWKRDGVDIGGATGSTYNLTQDDVDAAISVVASYTDAQGTAESVSSAATAVVANVNDAPTGSVTITGTPTQGQELTASNDLADIDGIGAITYQWQRDGVDIGGATGSSYTLTQDDVDAAISVVASYTDAQGSAESVISAATAAIANVNNDPTGTVAITGTPTQGQELTASNDLADIDGLGAITYQWQRDGVDIGGATGSTYNLTQDDVDAAISVVASYTDAQGTAESVSSAATAVVANVNDAPTGSVTITGTPTQGQELTASNDLADIDGLGAITYQWQRDGVDIGGATGSTYTLTQDDVDAAISVVAFYTDAQGTAESVSSAATAAIAVVNSAPQLTGDFTTQVNQGNNVLLQTADLFYADPDDADSDITFTTSNYVQGWIEVNGVQKNSFTASELTSDIVVFNQNGVYDGNPASFFVSVEDQNEDGSDPVPQYFTINVDPNDAPTLSGDLATAVLEGNNVLIESADLYFIDPDDNPNEVTFTASNFVQGWIEVNGVQQNTFTAGQIDADLVVFRHNGVDDVNPASFSVSVEDQNEDNSAPVAQSFTINVTPQNDAPQLSGDLATTVLEGDNVVIESGDLFYTDPDDNDNNDITFTASNFVQGFIEVDGVQQNTFTAGQVAANLVVFRHNGVDDINPASFSVSVEDQNEDLSAPVAQTFTVNVQNVNDAPQLIGDMRSVLVQYSSNLIMPGDLFYDDPDISDGDNDVTFTASNLVNGWIQVDGVRQNTFTAGQISANLVEFVHEGNPATNSQFDVSVEDQNEDSSAPVAQTFVFDTYEWATVKIHAFIDTNQDGFFSVGVSGDKFIFTVLDSNRDGLVSSGDLVLLGEGPRSFDNLGSTKLLSAEGTQTSVTTATLVGSSDYELVLADGTKVTSFDYSIVEAIIFEKPGPSNDIFFVDRINTVEEVDQIYYADELIDLEDENIRDGDFVDIFHFI